MRKISHFFAMVVALLCCCLVSCEQGEELYNPMPEIAEITVSLVSPTDASVGVTDTPTFEWTHEVTPSDLAGVVFDVYVGLSSSDMQAVELDCPDTSFEMTTGLTMGSTYYWKVVAHGTNAEVSSEIYSFTVRTLDAPVATAPADGTTISAPATFEWDQLASSDDSSYTYTIWAIEEGNTVAEEFAVGSVVDAGSYTMTDDDYAKFAYETSYEWWVTVTLGSNAAQSNHLTFYNIDANSPSTPKTLTPATSASFTSANDIEFTWEASTDPNGDDITYSIMYRVNGGTDKTLTTGASGTSFTGSVESADSAITEYTWWVVATDTDSNSTSSAVSNFYVTSSITLNSLTSNTLDLGEAITWNEGTGAKYSVYLKKNSENSYTQIATGLSSPSYKIPNSYMSSTLVTGAYTYNAYVTAVNGSITLTSNTITFKPAMSGTITDTRGTETNTYGWVRIGPRVWLTDNLKTAFFNDGTAIPYLDSGALDSDNLVSASTSSEAYYNTELYGYDHAHQSFWTDDSQQTLDAAKIFTTWDEETYVEKTGNVYSYWTAANENLAPEGWHTATYEEWGDLLSASDQLSLSTAELNGLGNATSLTNAPKIIHTDYTGGTNTLGLGLTPTATRASSSTEYGNVIPPFRNGLWQYQGSYWMIHEEYNTAFLDGDVSWETIAENGTYRLCYRLTIGYYGGTTWQLCRNTWAMGYLFAVRCVYDDDQN